MRQNNKLPIALVLSGGGVRAMAFHAGLLLQMAKKNELENIKYISTVSGGSLLMGLVFKLNQFRWPSSEEYINTIYPALKNLMCTHSLQQVIYKQMLNPFNWKFLLSRANLVAMALEKDFEISIDLIDLPKTPEWSINSTTAETGKRYRFKRDSMGDYEVGYANDQKFPLAKAMAVSAAFPGGIGPLYLKTKIFKWENYKSWTDKTMVEVTPKYSALHLYDGGVYDNLGLEPYFDSGTGKLKEGIEACQLIVSDAGAPLKSGFSYGELNPFRLKRISDIISDQARSVRVRSFLNYLQNKKNLGSYIYIADKNFVNSTNGQFACNFPTSLEKLMPAQFEQIANLGFEIAEAQ